MHEKHRHRMREKAIKDISTLEEHELLELILYYATPRVNTNPTAHALIEKFGSLNDVFNADPNTLLQIDGIGERSAALIATLNQIIDIIVPSRAPDGGFPFNPQKLKLMLKEFFADYTTEVFAAFYLDDEKQIISRQVICEHSETQVSLDLDDFSRHVVAVKPKYAIIAHNHTSGIPKPSGSDDRTTEKLCLVLAINKVHLLEHMILADDMYYSYFAEGRIAEIQNKVNRLL